MTWDARARVRPPTCTIPVDPCDIRRMMQDVDPAPRLPQEMGVPRAEGRLHL